MLTNLIGKLNNTKTVELAVLIFILYFAFIATQNNTIEPKHLINSDIQREYFSAVAIAHGQNPYLEANPQNLLNDDKVPGLFPLYYRFLAIFAFLADYKFTIFIDILRYFIFFSWVGLGYLLYSVLKTKGRVIAFLGMTLFMFNRWTLNDIASLKNDIYVLLIIVISLLILKKKPKTSYLMFGISIGLKHLSILVLPIYAWPFILTLWDYVKGSKNDETLVSLKNKLKSESVKLVLLALPVFITSLPFILDTSTNNYFFSSLLYNITRISEVRGLEFATGFDNLLVLYNQDRLNDPIFYILPRLVFFIALLIGFIAFTNKKLTVFQYCLFTYFIFIGFNPVLYPQYFVWFATFVPLSLTKLDYSL